YERPHKGVKASANSDIVYFFTSAQDGDPLQDDEAEYAGLKEAEYAGLKKAEYAGLNQAKYDRLIPSEICIQAEYDNCQAKYDRRKREEEGAQEEGKRNPPQERSSHRGGKEKGTLGKGGGELEKKGPGLWRSRNYLVPQCFTYMFFRVISDSLLTDGYSLGSRARWFLILGIKTIWWEHMLCAAIAQESGGGALSARLIALSRTQR
ncbi:hypothetical protein Tco_0994590, partial [Tanacetum coccineum]